MDRTSAATPTPSGIRRLAPPTTSLATTPPQPGADSRLSLAERRPLRSPRRWLWGAYLTGVEAATITFNDGTNQTINILNSVGGAEFIGFTDAGRTIASITINVLDIAGMDDVRYVTPAAGVPEPATLSLFGIALAGIGVLRRCKRSV